MTELSQFEYPDNSPSMYDPVLRLRVDTSPVRESVDGKEAKICIHYDPEIEQGRYTMPQPDYEPLEREVRQKWNWDFDRPIPFQSSRSQRLAELHYQIEACGDKVRLKINADGFSFRSYHVRGSIERLNIPKVSNDVSSMYFGVIKAYPGLPHLRLSNLSPKNFPSAKSIEICVTSSALTQGLGRSALDYPIVETHKPSAQRRTTPQSALVEAAHMIDEDWHCISSWPMLLD